MGKGMGKGTGKVVGKVVGKVAGAVEIHDKIAGERQGGPPRAAPRPEQPAEPDGADGAHCTAADTLEVIAELFEGLPGEDYLFQDEYGSFAYKRSVS